MVSLAPCCCENCRPILGRVQSWDQTCFSAKRILGGPVTLLWSALEVQSRSLGRCPEDQASVAVVVLIRGQLQPAQGGVYPGAFWNQSAQMFRNNCGSEIVFYCLVSLQVPRLPSCLLYFSFQAVKVTYLLYFWLANETFYRKAGEEEQHPCFFFFFFFGVPLKSSTVSQFIQRNVPSC